MPSGILDLLDKTVATSKARDSFTSRGLGLVLDELNFPRRKQSLIERSLMSPLALFRMLTQESMSDLVRLLLGVPVGLSLIPYTTTLNLRL